MNLRFPLGCVIFILLMGGINSSAELSQSVPADHADLNTGSSIWILDFSFADLGIFSFRPDHGYVEAVASQSHLLSDGRILIHYHYYWLDGLPGGFDEVLLVISPDGDLEEILPGDIFRVVAVQSGDKLIVLGEDDGSYFLTRYFSDFSPDPSFSTPPGVVPGCCSWVVQPDDKILMGSYQGGNVIRLNSDGSLDEIFPGDVDPFNQIDSLTSHQDGSFLVQEWYTTPMYCSAREYDQSGDLTGYLYNTPDFHPDNFCHFYAVQFAPHQNDGYAWIDNGEMVFRSSGDGDLIFEIPVQTIIDQSFGPDWTVTGPSPIATQPDGNILFSGLIQNDDLKTWYMSRLTPEGSPDTTFGVNGVYGWSTSSTRIGNYGIGWHNGLYTLPDGRILVVGYGDGTIYIARLYEMQVDTILYFPVLGR